MHGGLMTAEKRSRFADLGPGWISAISGLLAAIIAGIGLLISSSAGNQSSQMALSPAGVPPKIGLCRQQLQIGANGNAGPIKCGDGRLNQLAWEYFAKLNLNVMAVGPNVLPDQVLRVMCSDVTSGGSTRVIEITAYNLSALYYGWNFGISPLDEFLTGNC
jgi:hypothetical protein